MSFSSGKLWWLWLILRHTRFSDACCLRFVEQESQVGKSRKILEFLAWKETVQQYNYEQRDAKGMGKRMDGLWMSR